ncbi:hypothetical protein IMSAGC014_02085 [Bacteroidaceae bacterium]|nr:hypothetical protein IMSAGC014_02085 [Bacteroidaceae bacterium]
MQFQKVTIVEFRFKKSHLKVHKKSSTYKIFVSA